MSKPDRAAAAGGWLNSPLLVAGGPLLLLITGILLFPSSGRDDVHISYWAAQMLRDQGQLLTYAGVAGEQSSSLLHVMILALVSSLSGLDMPAIGTPLSVLFALLAVREAGLLARQLGAQATAVVWVTAACTPMVYWAFGALETTLVAFLLTAFLRQLLRLIAAEPERSALWFGFTLGLGYLLARPEAVFVQQSFLLAALLVCWPQVGARKRLLGLQLALLASFALLCLWRLQTFGMVFPLPVSAKVDLHLLDMLRDGFWYLGFSARQVPVFVLLPVAVALYGLWHLLRNGLRQPALWLCLLLVGSQCGFLLLSGGDWMEGARFFVPVLPTLVVVACYALGAIPAKSQALIVGGFVLASLLQSLWFARFHSTGIPLFQLHHYQTWAQQRGLDLGPYAFFDRANRVHLRDALFVQAMLPQIEAALDRQEPLIMMSSQAGMVPYYLLQQYAGRIRFVDMAGLTSREFVDCPQVLQYNPYRSSSRGIAVGNHFYLDYYDAFREQCGIPPADLYYNIDTGHGGIAQLLEDSGRFSVLHKQSETICAKGSWCPRSFTGHMVLARAVDAPSAAQAGLRTETDDP